MGFLLFVVCCFVFSFFVSALNGRHTSTLLLVYLRMSIKIYVSMFQRFCPVPRMCDAVVSGVSALGNGGTRFTHSYLHVRLSRRVQRLVVPYSAFGDELALFAIV